MILKSLKLQNYRRFEHLELEFPENLIGIIGRNGAGKSTIIEAIGWTLYGNRFVRTDKHDVRSQHADKKATCSAEIVFSYGGAEFCIERKLKGKNAILEAAAWRDGDEEAVAVQDSGVNDFIENLLQLDYRSFTTSVFAQQKELDKLTTLQPEQRRQAINRLINIDRIDRAREQVRRDRNEKQAFVRGKRSMLKDVNELKTREKTFKAEHSEKEGQQKLLQSKVKAQAEMLEQAREAFESISKLRDQYRSWDAQIATLKSRLTENQKNIQRSQLEIKEIEQAEKELSELAALLTEFDSVKKEKENFDEQREKFNQRKNRLDELKYVQDALGREQENKKDAELRSREFNNLQNGFEALSSAIEQLESEINETQEQIKTSHGEKITAESKGHDIRVKMEGIQKLGPDGECPVCTQRLGDHFETVLEDHEKQLSDLRSQYKKSREQEQGATDKLKALQKEIALKRREREEFLKKLKSAQDAQELVNKIDGHLKDYENQVVLIETAIKEIGAVEYEENRHKEIKAKYDQLVSVQQKAARLEERVARRENVESYIETIQKDIARIHTDIDSAQSSQAALGFNEHDFVQKKQDVNEKDADYSRIKDEYAAAAQLLAVLARDIENMKKEISEQKQLAADIKTTEEEIVYLNALDDYFGRFRLELAGRIRPLIAQRASELLSLTTHSRYSQIDLDQDYNIKIFDANVSYPIDRFSGGEQDLASLCLRIAISQVVAERSGGAPINFIVLDEIFGSQDAERRDLILNALGQLSSQFRQIFIITHIEPIKEMLPVLLNVKTRDEFVSEVEVF